MKKLLIALVAVAAAACAPKNEPLSLVPYPNHVEAGSGRYSIVNAPLACDEAMDDRAFASVATFAEQLAKTNGGEFEATKMAAMPSEGFRFVVDATVEPEGYRLSIGRKGVEVRASEFAGFHYAIQTIKQLLPAEVYGEELAADKDWSLPCLEIADAPRFGYRGMHLDVSRHFFSVEEVKAYIDIMAVHKLNRLHWHLTDDQGWRVEIKRFPKLTEVGSMRKHTVVRKDWGTYDGVPHGGFYTQDQIREVVEYAAANAIEVIPEIDLPGHMMAALAAYPELKCTHAPERQGDLCIGKEETFEMMQAILDEVIEIFPSEYIHIGGDEAGKGDWKLCEDCQRRMREEGLESVDELQSYMIHRIEEYLNARGRQIIGWDEILEGGLAPNATVMSWRGEEGGLMAAEAGHNVVMSPHGYCYIDAPQDAPYSQPESIGGYLPLEKVYSYDPAPATMSEDMSKYILGVQANLWAEFIVEDSHYEHMLWPRAIAIAEIGWSQPSNRDFTDFRRRAVDIVDRMIEEGYTPFDLKNEIGNRPESKEDVEHLALGKSVTYLEPSRYYAPKYAAAWDATLTDGKRGTWTYADERWQGFLGRGGVDVIIDLEKVTDIHSISADFMQICGPGVFMPCLVEIAISEDGENYTKIAEIEHEVVLDELPSFKSFGWEGSAKARYIRYKAHRSKYTGFLFVDEIVVK